MRLLHITALVWLACASAGWGQGPPPPGRGTETPSYSNEAEPYLSRQRAFAIPFQVDRGAIQPVEVQLFVSADRGASWQLYSRQRPDVRQFEFQAAEDGLFWFASRTIDAQNTELARRPLRPELQILIDSAQPQLGFQAASDAVGMVEASWQAYDPNLATATFRIEYRTGPDQPWQTVPVSTPQDEVMRATWNGQTSWRPTGSSTLIDVRAEIRDKAGNLTVANQRVTLPKVAAQPGLNLGDRRSPAGTASEGATPWPRDDVQPAPDPSRDSAAQGFSAAPADTGRLPSETAGLPPYGPVPSTVEPAVGNRVPATEASGPGRLPVGETPRITSTRHFQLDYDVDAAGASGVSEVQLWVSQDAGQSWQPWGVDPDRRTPFDVQVNEDGIFGFRIVVVNSQGRSSLMPQAGDPADLWVAVDTIPPVAELISAVYGQNEQAGKLIIQWQAEDSRLAARPISLQYGLSAEGPFTTIAAGIENTGQYVWNIEPTVPARVYLRLEVRDEAANAGYDTTTEPINLGTLIPKAQIRGLREPDPNRQSAEGGRWWR